MKKSNFIFFGCLLITLALCFTSCGGDDSSSDEDSYISFSGTGYSSKFQNGSSEINTKTRDEPFASYQNSWTSCIGMRELLDAVMFLGRQNPLTAKDYVYIAFSGNTIQEYSGSGNCIVEIKYAAAYSTTFRLTNPVVKVTKYNSNEIGGTFSGKDFSSNDITGKFLFTNIGDGKWYWFGLIPWPAP